MRRERTGSGWFDLNERGEVVPLGRTFDEFLDILSARKAAGDPHHPAGRFHLREQVGACDVSTVFLGLDHAYEPAEPPLVFETMVFGGPLADWAERYSTLLDAKFGHWLMVNRAREAQAWHRELRRRFGSALEALWPISQRRRLLCLVGRHRAWRGACTVCKRRL